MGASGFHLHADGPVFSAGLDCMLLQMPFVINLVMSWRVTAGLYAGCLPGHWRQLHRSSARRGVWGLRQLPAHQM